MKSYFSEIKVSPRNWRSKLKSNLKKDWIIYYHYFCDEYPTGKPIRFRGMNHEKTLEGRQRATQMLIDAEIENLKKGFNPVTRELESTVDYLNEKTPFLKSLDFAYKKLKCSDPTKDQIRLAIERITPTCKKTGLAAKEISTVRRRDVKIMLDELVESGASHDKYNRVRSYLLMLYNYFVQIEIFEFNYVRDIEILHHVPAKKRIFRADDKKVFAKLESTNYNLWRFCTIFYFSGCRISELRNVEISKISLENNYFTVFVKKGKIYEDVRKPINKKVHHLWKELLSTAAGNKYLFGNNFTPAEKPCSKPSFDNKYKRWVKEKLGLEITPYALRHTFLNDITGTYGLLKAQELAGHSNPKTTKRYAVDYEDMILDQQKNIEASLTMC